MSKVICSQCNNIIDADDVICMVCGCPNLSSIPANDLLANQEAAKPEEEEKEIQEEQVEETQIEEEKEEPITNEDSLEPKEELEEKPQEELEEEKPKKEPKEEKPKRKRTRKTTKKEEDEEEVEAKIEIGNPMALKDRVDIIAQMLKKESKPKKAKLKDDDAIDEIIDDIEEEQSKTVDLSSSLGKEVISDLENQLDEDKDKNGINDVDEIEEEELEIPQVIEEEEEVEVAPVSEPKIEEIKEEEPVEEEKPAIEEAEKIIEEEVKEETIEEETKEEVETPTEESEAVEEAKEEEVVKEVTDEDLDKSLDAIEAITGEDKIEETPVEEPRVEEIKREQDSSTLEDDFDRTHASLYREESFLLKASPADIIDEASELILKSEDREAVIAGIIRKYNLNREVAENYAEIAIKLAKTKLDKLSIGLKDEPKNEDNSEKQLADEKYINTAKDALKDSKDIETIAKILTIKYEELDFDTALVIADQVKRKYIQKLLIYILSVVLVVLLAMLIFL